VEPLRIPHFGKLCLFAFLSSADLVLTWWLVHGADGQVYESNPLAHWSLTRFGWLGLTVFKAAAVLLVVALCGVVSLYRPRLGGLVLTFACAVLGAVVAYSSSLAGCVGPEGQHACMVRTVRQREMASRWIDDELRKSREHIALMKQLSADVKAERRSISETVALLASLESQETFAPLRGLRIYYPDRTDEESLELHLLEFMKAD
jgi:hypothetical protein